MDLIKLIEQTAEGLGYEVVDIELSTRGRPRMLSLTRLVTVQILCTWRFF